MFYGLGTLHGDLRGCKILRFMNCLTWILGNWIRDFFCKENFVGMVPGVFEDEQ